MRSIFLSLLLLFLPFVVMAQVTDIYQFNSVEQRQQFQGLMGELRCLVCQNETLLDSSAPLAADLRLIVYNRVLEGESDQVIIDYLTRRYGDFILYNPPMVQKTYFLWFAPILMLCIGFFLLVRLSKPAAQFYG